MPLFSFTSMSRLEQESIRRTVTEAASFFSGTMLDMGCGSRPYAPLAHERGCRYIGIDLSLSHTPPPDVCADSLQLPFCDNCFDTVLSTQVLEHVVNPFSMMREAARVLKPGGHLVLTAPQAWPLHEEPHDFFRYTRYGLAQLAREHGLRVVYLRERGGGISALAQLISVILYDAFGARAVTRIPVKLFTVPFLWVSERLDKILYYPKFTLGYILVAQK